MGRLAKESFVYRRFTGHAKRRHDKHKRTLNRQTKCQLFAKPKEPKLPPHRDKDKNLKNKNNFAYFDELKMTFKNI